METILLWGVAAAVLVVAIPTVIDLILDTIAESRDHRRRMAEHRAAIAETEKRLAELKRWRKAAGLE